MVERKGPLTGTKVVEIGSIGPGPLCAMLLADLGADVIRVDRINPGPPLGPSSQHSQELLNRGRRSVAVDLKDPRGVELVLELIDHADALIEGFRPGVMERLGLGPDLCLERNPRLVYGRMTGWGQDGPMAQAVGHDINYIALNGVLGLIGRQDQPPSIPLNLVGDGGGGGLMLAFGLLAALLERARSGKGQVIDAAMIEGAAVLATPFFGYQQIDGWNPERGTNLVDTGAPFYDSYETSDGRWLSVGSLEPQFFKALLEMLEIDAAEFPAQYDLDRWPEMRESFERIIRSRTQAEWAEIAQGFDACVAPLLSIGDLAEHPHLAARGSFVEQFGFLQPAPSPRFSRTPGAIAGPPPEPGQHTDEALSDWGVEPTRIESLKADGTVNTSD